MGVLLAVLACVGPISGFLQDRAASSGLSEASRVVSLLSLVMGIAFLVGGAYAIVAISSQTQLQEELPEDVRGRVFGVLNMLVSIASLAPIIVVGPVADLVGREPVILVGRGHGLSCGGWPAASAAAISRSRTRPGPVHAQRRARRPDDRRDVAERSRPRDRDPPAVQRSASAARRAGPDATR